MIRIFSFYCVMSLANLCLAQDFLITNARIIDGKGTTIPQGTITVSGTEIVSVSGGVDGSPGRRVIDVQGMTVMPGFIDTHRHVIQSNLPVNNQASLNKWLDEQAPKLMFEYLEAGFTTIMSAGDLTTGIIELRRRLQSGEILGPRLQVSGDRIKKAKPGEFESCQADAFCRENRSFVRNAEEARAKTAEMAKTGVDMVKVRFDGNDPNGLTKDMLVAVIDEAKRQGIPSIVHATAVPAVIASVEAGVTRQVHTPHTGTLAGTEGVRIIKEASVPVSSTLGVWVPMFRGDNLPRFRNGMPFPRPGIARAGQGPVNARYLWDGGVIMAYGTDTPFSPAYALIHELRPLRLLFSPSDIVVMLTRNAAVFMDLDDKLGTLEPGKLADIVVLDGDPLKESDDLLKVKLVIKEGRIVVDRR